MGKIDHMEHQNEDSQFVEELKPHEDRWVALVGRKVVASGTRPKEVAEKAEKAGYTEYTFYLVPSSSVLYAPSAWPLNSNTD